MYICGQQSIIFREKDNRHDNGNAKKEKESEIPYGMVRGVKLCIFELCRFYRFAGLVEL